MTSLDYKIGDYVTIYNSAKSELEIGKIVEITEPSSFSYILFCRPEELHCGRLMYHGKNELFKMNISDERDLSSIVSKVQLLKLEEYVEIPREEKFATDLFVCRQKYDPNEKFFYPEAEPDCFCSRIVNPDDDLVVCKCTKAFHVQCINEEQNKCPTCENLISKPDHSLVKKRKLEDDNTILLKSDKDEEFYEIFATALDKVSSSDKKDLSNHRSQTSNKSLNEKRPISTLSKKNSKGPQQNSKPSGQIAKKPTRKELVNIEDEGYDRIKAALDIFSKAHNNKTMSDVEKNRYFNKERYYKSLLYGIEEVKEKHRQAGSHMYLAENERKIALNDQRENYKNAQNIALNIEAVIWHALNKNKARIDPNYSMKNRELLNYLMDENNSELRLAILVGDKKPEFLCQASGKELVSKEMSQKIEKKEMDTLKLSLLPDEVKIITKSHKGEMVIENQENEPQPTTEAFREADTAEDDSDLINDVVNKIERRGSEPAHLVRGLSNSSETNLKSETAKLSMKKWKSSAGDCLSDSSDCLLSASDQQVKRNKRSVMKKGSEDVSMAMSKTGTNKMIDQELLRNITGCFFEKIYNTISERMKNHLKPEVVNKVLKEIDKKFKKNLTKREQK